MTVLPSLGRLDQVHAAIACLFDARVGVGVTDPRAPQPLAIGSEAAHLAAAVPRRKAEFAAGRTAARDAMVSINIEPCQILAHADRAPIWPVGINGSISHKNTLCAAVVARAPVFLGLDIEEDTDLATDLLATICSKKELARIAGPDQGRLAKLIFSAKEAAYKAQYPLTRQLFGFETFDVALDQTQQRFTARFTKSVAPFAKGDRLQGRFALVADHLVTAVSLRQGACKGA